MSLAGITGALTLIRQGRDEEGLAVLREMKQTAIQRTFQPFEWDYFYSGNPNPTFEEDNQKQQRLSCTLLAGLAAAALGEKNEA